MKINKDINTDYKSIISELMQAPFTTGALIVDFSQNQVILNGETLVLQPKVLELLITLCSANGKTLSKTELIDTLWPNTIVGPDSLANTMTRLRKILNDDAKKPIYIKTVQRKGYLWLPSVVKNKKTPQIKYLLLAASIFFITLSLFFVNKPKPEKFPFPDLSIQKLNDGGYEIQVGIEGELTEEKKVAMLEKLKQITGEKQSDMNFTIDTITPDCDLNQIQGDTEQHCKNMETK